MLTKIVRASVRGDHMLKANDVAHVIEERVDSRRLDAMRLQKLLYYVQAWHLAIKGEPLFDGRFEAWPEGPVMPEVLDGRLTALSRRAQVRLDDQVSELIDVVLREYGSLSSDELTEVTKAEFSWQEAREDLDEGAPSTNVISNETMREFYTLHRQLQGYDAGDPRIAGIQVRPARDPGPFDSRAFFASLGPEFDDPPGDNPWPSANWESCGDELCGCKEMKGRRPADPGA